MNRYTAQILAFLLVVVIAIMMLSLTGIVIWHLLLKDASRYKTFKRLHYVLLASAPLTLMIYNVFSLILLMVLSQDPLRGLIAIPLVPLSIFHLVAIGIRLNKGEGEQGGGGNALELPNHPSTAHSTMRATP